MCVCVGGGGGVGECCGWEGGGGGRVALSRGARESTGDESGRTQEKLSEGGENQHWWKASAMNPGRGGGGCATERCECKQTVGNTWDKTC